jgi:hypothetical protein
MDRFKMAREFERDHGVTRFLKKIAELAGGIFAALCAADTSCVLFPVGHRELCEGIVTVSGSKLPVRGRKRAGRRGEAKGGVERVPVLARRKTVLVARKFLASAFTD